jgi:MscS family membrane protein
MRFGAPLGVLAGILIIYGSRLAFFRVLRFAGDSWIVLSVLIWVLIFAGVGWLVFLVTGRIADAINEARQVKEGSIDSQLIRILLRLLSLVILVFLVIYAAGFFGVPLTPVVAGLGVGGLAIALAVRPTLENVIGGLTLFADKPVRIGDWCRFGNEYARVEEIGLRSTRLRRRDDTVISVPNADFAQRELINYTRRRQRLYGTTLALRYETTSEQLRYVIAKLREMLLGHPKVSPHWLHVRFRGFGAYSFDVEVFAFIRVTDWLEFRAIREDINLRIMDIVKEAGTGFAFPSQTTYLGRDTGLDVERGREAETRVQEWRSKGQLPFPEFDEGVRREKQDTLDYPPEGSPEYKSRAGSSDPPPEPQAPPPAEPKPTGRRLGLGAKRR